MEETVAGQFQPGAQIAGVDAVVVDRKIIGRAGVQAGAAVLGDQGRILVRYSVFGGRQRDTVDLLLDGLAGRLVGRLLEAGIHRLNGVQIDFLGLVINRSDAVGTLEHDVFEIVCDAGVRTVHRSGADQDRAVDDGGRMVLVEVDLQAVGEGQVPHGERALAETLREQRHSRQECRCKDQKCALHYSASLCLMAFVASSYPGFSSRANMFFL